MIVAHAGMAILFLMSCIKELKMYQVNVYSLTWEFLRQYWVAKIPKNMKAGDFEKRGNEYHKFF